MAINKVPPLQNFGMWAAVAAASIGVLFYNVMPVFLGSLQDSHEYSGAQIGMVASAFFFGFNLAGASAFFWVKRIQVRKASFVCTAVICAFLLMTALFPAYFLILSSTFVFGAASGALAAIAATVIGEAEHETWWYGIKVAMESAAGVLLLFVLPGLFIASMGFLGTVVGMTLFIALLAPVLFKLDGGAISGDVQASEAEQATTQVRDGHTNGVWLALLATLVLFVGGSAIWAFEERIANLYGFDAVWVGAVLGASLFFAVIGPLAAGPLGDRFGNRIPYAAGALFMVVGVLLIAGSSASPNLFALGACSFMLGWGASVPFLFSTVSGNDSSGKYVALMIPALGIGSMIGPTVAGFLYDSGSLAILQWISIAMILGSVALIWLSGNIDQVFANDQTEQSVSRNSAEI